MSIARPFAAGTVLSLAAVAGLASQDPGPANLPPLSLRHPQSVYLALAAAPFGNGWELFAPVAFIYFACFLVSGWRRRARTGEPEN